MSRRRRGMSAISPRDWPDSVGDAVCDVITLRKKRLSGLIDGHLNERPDISHSPFSYRPDVATFNVDVLIDDIHISVSAIQ